MRSFTFLSLFSLATATFDYRHHHGRAVSSGDAGASYWLEDMKHQGISAFNPNPTEYQVFRNVKDFGAKGDGKTDDTKAIQQAISTGDRCAPGSCNSTTTTPALVYFPCGTYLLTDSLVNYYYTMIVGNPNCMPVLQASSNFTASWVIDGNQYQEDGNPGWGPTNVFFTQIKNLVIDTTHTSPKSKVTGINWTVSQATSLQNIIFKLSAKNGTQHEGVFIAEGSGGFLSDLVIHGGNVGLDVGNQQFTMRNLTFHGVNTAINMLWDWGWTYKSVSIHDCKVGLNMTALNPSGGSMTFFDSEIYNTPIGIVMARGNDSALMSNGSLIIENVHLQNVPVAVKGPVGTALTGTNDVMLIKAWGQGHSHSGSSGQQKTFQAAMAPNNRPASLVSGNKFYERSKPSYKDVPASEFISIRDSGAKGDGKTDDTAAIIAALSIGAARNKIVFFDAGTYKVTQTIFVPSGSRIVGEALPVIMSSGAFFAEMRTPRPVVQFGQPGGQAGWAEWSDVIVSTQGAQAGAVLIEYNFQSPTDAPTGLWEVHARTGGFAGSQLQVEQCRKTPSVAITAENLDQNCIANFMTMHVTPNAGGLYMENCWLWVADHDIEDPELTQITLYAGRGLLVESTAGAVWLYGTAVEHHVLYEYQLVGTRDVVMGQIQTETAYYQPNPGADIPFPPVASLHDPELGADGFGWGMRIVGSEDILVYGAGLYSFFNDYSTACSDQGNATDCQRAILSVEDSKGVSVYNLNTVGAVDMATVDGQAVAKSADNRDGFVDTLALLRV
ncbi:putative Exo-beta-1,3-glucanae [Xylariomycetidae sp. FL0641]|nr:putative Exo-beta-1,3-glucanae [Xylariomycetidae sp. FL0641]